MFKLPRGLGADRDFLEKWSSGKQMLDIILQLFKKRLLRSTPVPKTSRDQ